MIVLICQCLAVQAILEIDRATNSVRERSHTSNKALKVYYFNKWLTDSKQKEIREQYGSLSDMTTFKEWLSDLKKNATSCSENFPFAFDNGNKCCFSNKERKETIPQGTTASPGNPCNGGKLSYTSVCCDKYHSVDCTNTEFGCYSNEKFMEKRLTTRTVPYELDGNFKLKLDTIDVTQRQCMTNMTELADLTVNVNAPLECGVDGAPLCPCDQHQECLFSQRGNVADGKWGCYDVECPFNIPFRFGQTFDDDTSDEGDEEKPAYRRGGWTDYCCYTREYMNGTDIGICRNDHTARCMRRSEMWGDAVVPARCKTNEAGESYQINTMSKVVDESKIECDDSCPIGLECVQKTKPQKLKSTDEPTSDTGDTGFECGFNFPLRRWIAIMLVVVALISYPTLVIIWVVRRKYANSEYLRYSYLTLHRDKYKPKAKSKKESGLKKKVVSFCKTCGVFHGCADHENDGNNYTTEKDEYTVAEGIKKAILPVYKVARVASVQFTPQLEKVMEYVEPPEHDAKLLFRVPSSDDENETIQPIVTKIDRKPVNVEKTDVSKAKWSESDEESALSKDEKVEAHFENGKSRTPVNVKETDVSKAKWSEKDDMNPDTESFSEQKKRSLQRFTIPPETIESSETIESVENAHQTR